MSDTETEWAERLWGKTLPCGCARDNTTLCFKHKLKTIQFGGSPHSKTLMEKRWDRDMPAYMRLRRNGLQPAQIDGCAELETRANTQIEVEMADLVKPLAERSGQPLKTLLPKIQEGMQITRETEWKPQDSVEDKKNKYDRA